MALTERGGHVNLAQREIEQNKSQLERVKEKLAQERVRAGQTRTVWPRALTRPAATLLPFPVRPSSYFPLREKAVFCQLLLFLKCKMVFSSVSFAGAKRQARGQTGVQRAAVSSAHVRCVVRALILSQQFSFLMARVLSLRAECDSLRRQLELASEKLKNQEELTTRAEVRTSPRTRHSRSSDARNCPASPQFSVSGQCTTQSWLIDRSS